MMSERKKFCQLRREAAATGIVLLLLILFWLAAGFGLSSFEIRIFHLPLWAVMGTVGVWFMAILLVRTLTRTVFQDMPLSEKEGDHD